MYLPVLAIPVGLVLGILAIAETGPEGTRSGRGLAITGTVLNSVLLVGIVAAGIGLYSLSQHVEATNRGAIDSTTEHDFKLIRERLREYYLKNDKSLASGGPVLAKYVPQNGSSRPRGRGPVPANAPAPKTGSMVTAELRLEDLVGENELFASPSLYELQVTGRASALVRFNSWDHTPNRLMTVFDVGRDQYAVTQE